MLGISQDTPKPERIFKSFRWTVVHLRTLVCAEPGLKWRAAHRDSRRG